MFKLSNPPSLRQHAQAAVSEKNPLPPPQMSTDAGAMPSFMTQEERAILEFFSLLSRVFPRVPVTYRRQIAEDVWQVVLRMAREQTDRRQDGSRRTSSSSEVSGSHVQIIHHPVDAVDGVPHVPPGIPNADSIGKIQVDRWVVTTESGIRYHYHTDCAGLRKAKVLYMHLLNTRDSSLTACQFCTGDSYNCS